jgi:hypothetical protein
MKTIYFNFKQTSLLALTLILCSLPFWQGTAFAQSVTYHVAQKNPNASDADNITGTMASPYLSIARGLKNIKPGDRVIIHEGIYRESADVTVSGTKEKPITIEAYKNEKIIMRGSTVVTSWKVQPGSNQIYIHDGWTKYFGTWKPKVSDARDAARNQIYANGEYIEEVPLQTNLKEGTFYIDKATKRIFLWLKNNDNPNNQIIEVSDRDYCLSVKADYIIVRGINVEYGANGPQATAMFRTIGNHNIIEDCSVHWAAGSGFLLGGNDNLIRRCVFNNNGQIGFGSGRSNYCLFEDCETSYNNLHTGKYYSTGWEAGGNKVAFAKAVNFLRHVSIGNNGPGIWYDISNDSCEVKNCFTQNNKGSGLFYEISYRLHATDNVMIGNGLNSGQGDWGANGGITLSSSPGCIVERNIMINNVDGFQFREQGRTTPEITGLEGMSRFGNNIPIWNHNQIIRNNIMAFNNGAQLRGWLDVSDGRIWPAYIKATLPEKEKTSVSSADWAAGYQAKDNAGQPKDLTLEMLHFNIDNNYYWAVASNNQVIFQWGVSWKHNVKYNDLATLSKELNFESNGKIINPMFNDWQNLDFRVPKNSPFIKNNSYPHGGVPRVKLGIIKK